MRIQISSRVLPPVSLIRRTVEQLRTGYVDSTPFKHVVVDTLFRDDLLRSVKDECIEHLSFTEKETDIYKVRRVPAIGRPTAHPLAGQVNQTGDLASLSYLSDDQRALFPNLLALRDALYSFRFRTFLQAITGCGPLSGTTQDMSVNSYTRGCHLLNHDDVIGTRRVSYILYMPIPCDKTWRTEYGGALELYPVREGGDIPEPQVAPVKAIPPSWNQFVFFEVQPGRSFHSVEEVVVDKDGCARLSISGWFHAAQPGEDGYVADETAAPQESASSREQLTSSSNASTCAGTFTQYDDTCDDTEPPHPDIPLSSVYTSFLTRYINPAYLQLRMMKTIMAKFVNESNLPLQGFLVDELAAALEEGLGEADMTDGLDETSRGGKMPSHELGVPPSSVASAWIVKGPPHRSRYCTLAQEHALDASSSSTSSSTTTTARAKAESILRELQDTLFPSEAFRAWLTIVTKLIPLSCAVEARRFRPGLDYTLATSDEGESRLDVVLGLTPQVQPKKTEVEDGIRNGKAKAKASEDEDGDEDEDQPTGWQAGEWGGWECYMAPHDEEDDPAVYRSGSSKKSQAKERPKSSGASASNNVDDDMDEDEEDEDGTLLTWQPHFNCLLLVLRDEGVLRFVKYVSAAAPGSRWDICSEFEVGMVDDDEDEEEEEP
ncbi:Oxoglutarate and iron-dependent oxygenase degradation C-term-domain-containing protein [Lanmaoa asiatica]|nr:Oxoglutarate and iron-dependent oxygenase degradation C-term-domain-containing protein [Lanmaoa asiatica]